ncbi:hypothetical protein KIN20_021174 [Parelaphostrongylus tenuis]|uniref:Uncharacterized protein n=1 Tax=Parelaphostrongylus tenuis TaxID=148309 RepID=A0AAD5QUB6_PARTN|nr:hypothetical protein KIN20_021174 [Parelaphostrongylus tenuis]
MHDNSFKNQNCRSGGVCKYGIDTMMAYVTARPTTRKLNTWNKRRSKCTRGQLPALSSLSPSPYPPAR